ncbi:MAG: 30S ribosome-binding factor RbfA [Bacteroidota bacterium]
MSVRMEKVASLVKQELSTVLQREFSEVTTSFVTVTEVRMTADLKTARVYVSVFGDTEAKEKTMLLLDEEKPHIRSALGSHIRLKFTPALEFFIDDTFDQVEAIDKLLKRIHRNE